MPPPLQREVLLHEGDSERMRTNGGPRFRTPVRKSVRRCTAVSFRGAKTARESRSDGRVSGLVARDSSIVLRCFRLGMTRQLSVMQTQPCELCAPFALRTAGGLTMKRTFVLAVICALAV